MVDPKTVERVHAETREQWRDWLEANHDAAPAVWLVTWRKQSGRPVLSYADGVTEALAFGWVDSKGAALDDERTMLYYCPRKRGSGWSRPNKIRVETLEREGRMADAGRRVIEAAKADGSWSLLDDVEDMVVPEDLAAALDRVEGARVNWDAFPDSARKGILQWIVQAKRPATRAQRVEQTAEKAGRGERANQWTRKT